MKKKKKNTGCFAKMTALGKRAVQLWFYPEELDVIDSVRGTIPRATWIRENAVQSSRGIMQARTAIDRRTKRK